MDVQAEGMPVARGFQGTPLMMDRVLYITGNNNYAWAMDARTGRQIWRYRRLLPPALTYGDVNPSNRSRRSATRCSWAPSTRTCWRSTATRQDRLGHPGRRLQGGPCRHRRAARDQRQGGGGNSGGDIPTRGFLDAYDAQTGKRVWRFYTIPGDGDPGADGRRRELRAAAPRVTGSYDRSRI
jgi:alcohol dehydrogenase (cytochrome c)